jgi:hypothetical protein
MLCFAEEALIEIGMTTSGSPGDSPGMHTITAWFKQKVYQCNLTPSSIFTTYKCDIFSFIGCDASSAIDGAKILFDNEHIDASLYSRIWIKTTEAEYGITGVCIPDSAIIGGYYTVFLGTGSGNCDAYVGSTNYNKFCIDGEDYGSGGSCWPPQQMIHFDTTQPGADIDNAFWEDAQGFPVSTGNCGSEEKLVEIGITTAGSPGQSPAVHTLTVWFKQKVYQCNLTPKNTYTTYTCDASSFIGCDTSSDINGAKILFDNDNGDASLYERIWITTTAASYGITGVCIPDSATIGGYYTGSVGTGSGNCDVDSTNYKKFCIDSDAYGNGGSCWPPQQMLSFDTTQPGVDIDNAFWEDAQGVQNQIATGDCACDVSGLGLAAKPHSCECKAECVDSDRFCIAMDFILGVLNVNDVEGYCPGALTCCCSCDNCPGFIEL